MRAVLLAACLTGVPAGWASGEVVYGQGVVSDPALVGRGWFSHSEARATRNYKHADEFVLEGDATVTLVRWWGQSEGRFRPDLGNFDTFTIEFFRAVDGDASPLPGTLVASTTVALEATKAAETGRLNPENGAIEYVHTAVLGAAVELEAGVTYFLAVSAHSLNGRRDGWMWADADGSDRYSATYSWAGGEWAGYVDTDSAFELIGVPAPGGACLVASAGGWSLRRRR